MELWSTMLRMSWHSIKVLAYDDCVWAPLNAVAI